MSEKYILALDQGTTSSRAVLFDREGKVRGMAQKEIGQFFPKPGWVEHDPLEIWSSQMAVASEAALRSGITPAQIEAIGITNQRETTLIWDKRNGSPLHRAIVWQDRRTAAFCDELGEAGYADLIREKTGLEIDSYFSATKIKWLLDHLPSARQLAARGYLAFGTVDSWLIWNLTRGAYHLTDVTNASRTMLFNIHTLEWDPDLLKLFDIPAEVLPEVRPTSSYFADTAGEIIRTSIPVCGVSGDQQAAMFGQMCVEEGMMKNTYGTGCFLMMNVGQQPVNSKNRMITTIGWQLNGETTYALEGSVFTGGAVVQWLRDGLKILNSSGDVEKLARLVEDTDGVTMVPAFSGLGAPYWHPEARGLITGIHRGTTQAHIARAALESIAFQSHDVMSAMQQDRGEPAGRLRADGGAARNDLLLQIQADLSQVAIERAAIAESTSLGAAFFAGLATGYWKGLSALEQIWVSKKTFYPSISKSEADERYARWQAAVRKTLH